MKNVSHSGSGEANRHCEKEGDGADREAKREKKKRPGASEKERDGGENKIILFMYTETSRRIQPKTSSSMQHTGRLFHNHS